MFNEENVCGLLNDAGYAPLSATELGGGSNHYVFLVQAAGEKIWIVKFPRIRETEMKYQQEHCDTLFGGRLSLQREAFLLDRIRAAGLPTPKVSGVYSSSLGDFIVMDLAPGKDLPSYMADCGHSLDAFLRIMESLGRDMAKLHQVRYPSFGNIMAGNQVEPSGILNFADRYLPINERIIAICRDKGGLSQQEATEVSRFFQNGFKRYRSLLDVKNNAATLVMTDLHGGNFFVEYDQVSSYFDVESSQAAPAVFELYALRFFVFNFYGQEEQAVAEKAFWNAYSAGKFDEPSEEVHQLIDFFSACRLLEIFQSYWGYVDGLRDTWGQRIKDLLFDYMKTGRIDYVKLGVIWRERDGQPEKAVWPPAN